MIYLLYLYQDWTLLAVRIAVAAIFLIHGWPKLKNLKTTAENFNSMGFRPGKLWGPFIAILEVVGGILLLLGFAIQVLGILFAIEMLVAAIWKIKHGQKFAGGYELDVLLVVASLILITNGSGAFGLDRLFFQF